MSETAMEPLDSTLAARTATVPRGVAAVGILQSELSLVEGTTFAVSGRDGEMDPDLAHGLFVRDTRLISRWRLRVDGFPIEPLTSQVEEPFHGVIVSRSLPRGGNAEGTIIVERDRFVAGGMREDIRVHNYGREVAALDLSLEVGADFADVFEVKDHRFQELRQIHHDHTSGELEYLLDGPPARSVRVSSPEAQAGSNELLFHVVVEPRDTWMTTVRVTPGLEGEDAAQEFPQGRSLAKAAPAVRLRDWSETAPAIHVENVVMSAALTHSERDLGSLRIVDADHPDDDVVAAGVPWFMALFGRDSLLASHFMVPFAPELALSTLRALARMQGVDVNQRNGEEPGRILHEMRLGANLALAPGGESINFGSIDSTPLFVQLCGQLLQWGTTPEQLADLRPAVERALQWIVEWGDRDGDGFVEYQRSSDRGLLNQGWKDSLDSMSFSNGMLADAPIALAEVQGYCYAAFQAAALLETEWGDPVAAKQWTARAAELKQRFHKAFWLPELGFYAMALDRDKQPLDVVSSNVGHVLWTRIADDSVVTQIAAQLLAPDMFTGFGVRTLSRDAQRYNPASYHNGSVWPHDTTIAAAGLAAYGYRTDAAQITSGLLDALEAFGGRLPELFCGFDRARRSVPVPYPTSCMPQAWAAAAPYELLRLSLDLQVVRDGTSAELRAHATPDFLGEVDIEGLRLGERHVHLRADGDGVTFA